MKLYKLIVIILLSSLGFKGYAQLSVNPVYTACPGQPVTVTATWPNVIINTMSLTSPAGASPVSGPLGAVTSFSISHSATNAAVYGYVLTATGTAGSGAVTGSVAFNLQINPPPPVAFTNAQYDYCAGNTATMDATPGANSYIVTSSNGFNQVFTSNIITIPNIASVHNGTYLVTSVGTCTSTGIFTINVAPNTPVTVNTNSNVCQALSCPPFGPYTNSVQLNSNIPNGQNYVWTHPQGFAYASTSTAVISCPQPTDVGCYTVTVDEPFNAITCPRSAAVCVSVVPTSPVSANASPASIVCENDKINFNAGATNPFGWTWTGPNGFSSSIANPVINPAKPVNSGVYTVSALFTNNVITCTTQNTLNVTVISVIQPAITMPNSICQGAAALNFSATATGAIAWQWTGPNSFSSTAQSTNIAAPQPNASGIYYVTSIFGQPGYTCAATNSTQLNVVPVNTVSVIPPAPVCMPNNGYLQASAIGAYQYSWVGPNNFNSPASNPIVYYPTTSATGIYTVTAFFTGGNIICTNTNTVLLTVNPVLIFSLTPRYQGCYGTSLTVLGPSGATSYSWTSSNGFTSNSKDIVFSDIQPKNSGTYTLNISLGPCITSGSTTIDILTPIEYTLQPLSRTVCSGDTTYAEVGLKGGSQNYAYDWSPAIYFTDDQRGPKKTIIPKTSIFYSITAYDIACPHYTLPTQFSLNVNQPPKPDLKLESSRGCVPFTQIYNPQTFKEAFVTTYDFGGLLKYQSSDSLTPITLDKAGIYTLTIYSKGKSIYGGCSGVYEYPYPIIVDPKPDAEIHWSPEMPTTNDLVTFIPSNLNGPIVKRFWRFGGGEPSEIDTAMKTRESKDTSIAMNPVRKYTDLGRYPVTITMQTEVGCEETVLRFITITDDFKVYIPNTFTPNNDGLNDLFMVKGSGMKTEGFSMEVKDRWGNSVYTTSDISAGWDGRVNGINAELGNYIYRIRAVGMNGEGRKEFVGHVTLMR